jgi:acetoin utilization protein AcuC
MTTPPAILSYDPSLTDYRLSSVHPLQPERFSLAVDLMESWGFLDDRGARVIAPPIATTDDLELAHSPDYLRAVRRASTEGISQPHVGIGPGDTPVFRNMHDAAAAAVGATCAAVDAVLAGDAPHAYSPAGGLHHAHRDHASGFCIYNDAVVAIERAVRAYPGIRIAYVDFDAHHGDGVEAAFVQRSDVLTLSVHESGRYLFPGTGRATDTGQGEGLGMTVNVPLPPYAGDACYELVTEQVVIPALRAFSPDMIVCQGGADTHRGDPLTHLDLTVAGYANVLSRVIEAAGSLCSGRLVLLGGGGYQPFSAVPRMWAAAMALLLGRDIPETIPTTWLHVARKLARDAGLPGPHGAGTLDEEAPPPDRAAMDDAMAATLHSIAAVREASPLLPG